ncbi:DnaJ C-terminal domain-containing protein [Magnetococcales bacterium HHB-1]
MGAEFKDFYKTLGIDNSAGPGEIKRAFRTLARKHHPDVNKGQDHEARFKEISEAYDVLGDSKKRAEYDKIYAYWKNGGSFSDQSNHGFPGGFEFHQAGSAVDLEGLFNSLFGKGSRGNRGAEWFSGFPGHTDDYHPSHFSRGFDAAPPIHEVEISLEEAYHGCKRQFEIQTPGNRSRQIKVTIPAGVIDGQTIHLGAKPKNGRSAMGDLYLKVSIMPHHRFRVEGRDTHLELPVTPWEAALGDTVTVPTLGGPVRLKIPAGSQSGQKLSLKGRGLPGSPPGSQYVTLNVVVPPPKTEHHRAFYRKMKTEMPFDPRTGFIH